MVTKRIKKSAKLEPREYHKIVSNLQLHEIYLRSFSASLDRDIFLKCKNLTISLRDRATTEGQEGKLKVTHSYYLKAMDPETQKKIPLKISATFRLIFSSKYPIEKEFFDIFKKINLPLNSWPYFREFAQSTTQRMNIPPLTLPFFKS